MVSEARADCCAEDTGPGGTPDIIPDFKEVLFFLFKSVDSSLYLIQFFYFIIPEYF